MRRTYYLLTALLLQLFSMGIKAQTSSPLVMQLGYPLITDVGKISSNASDEDEGQHLEYLIDNNGDTFWHSDWHGKVSDPHYLQFELSEPVSSGNIVVFIQRRNNDTDHFTNARLSGSEDGETWDDLADIEFGSATKSAQVLSPAIPIDKTYNFLRLTHTGTAKSFFHMAEIELYNPSDQMLVLGVLDEAFVKYENMYWEGIESMNIGTGFGQYTNGEAAEQLLEALNRVYEYMEDPNKEGFPDMDGAKAMAAEIDELYAAYWNSVVPYSIPADGYYRIVANLQYYNDEDTGEKDENDQPVYNRKYYTKAMFCSLDKTCSWGTLNEERANFIWKLTQQGDCVDMFNAGMETRISLFADPVLMSEEATGYVMFDYAGKENGRDIFYIRSQDGQREGEDYLHQWEHRKGTMTEDHSLCTWMGTFGMGDPYDTDKGTSEWYLEPVSEEEALGLIENFQPIKNHDLLVEQNNKLRSDIRQAIETAKDYIEEKRITSAEQMTSPFSQNDLGDQDGGNLGDGVLIDGNADTYWHSAWSAGEVETGSHYIQLSGMEKLVGKSKIYVHRRKGGGNQFTEFTLRGSNDPEAADEEWTTITVQAMGNAEDGKEFTTPYFDAGDTPYSYVRVYATKSTFWHCAELQIYSYLDNPNSQFAALGELSTTLENTLNENEAKADADITIEDYEALLAAYEAFLGGMVDPTDLRNALADCAHATDGYVEGTAPGYWSDATARETFDKLYAEVSDYDKSGRYTAEQNRKYVAALRLAARNVTASANRPATDKWYSIKVPSEALYDENGWDKNNVNEENTPAPLYDNYFGVGQGQDLDDNLYDYWGIDPSDIREGIGMYALDKEYIDDNGYTDGSLFRFIPMTNGKLILNDITDLAARGREALDMTTTYSYGKDLITDKSQLSSNASDRAEGLYLENLIDGNVNTFWHSDWHGEATAPHYLQVKLPEPVSGAVQVRMTRRQGYDYGDIRRMYVTAGNDGNEWTNIGYVEFPFGKVSETILTNPIRLDGSYTQLRFILAQRGGDNTDYNPFDTEKWTYFHAAEFQVRKVEEASEPTPAATALKEVLDNTALILRKDLTAEDYATMLAAYNAMRSEVNAGEMPVVPAMKEKAGYSYALQNKACGLFINTADRNSNAVSLQLMPTSFEYSAAGYGENLLHGFNTDGKDCTYLHAQKRDHRLVTWESNTAGTNSGLMLEEGGETDQTEFTFLKDIKMGHIYKWCYPVTLTNNSEGKAYTLAGTYTTDDGKVYLALNETETIKAGQPAIYIYGETEDWQPDTEGEENERTAMEFGLTTDLNLTAGNENGLYGTMVSTHVDPATLVFTDNKVTCVEDEAGTDVAANKSYVVMGEVPTVDENGTYSLCIEITDAAGNAVGVEEIVAKVSRTGNIYTTDGRLVRRGGTMNDLKRLGRGTYILNGVKVLVK